MIGVAGAGAFGTALAIMLGRQGRPVVLWGRDAAKMQAIADSRRNEARLPGVDLPESVTVTADRDALSGAEALLLTLPMQQLGGFLAEHDEAAGWLVACCKGIDLTRLTGPAEVIRQARPGAGIAVLTGPSFAADIARGLPTALTLAGGDAELQHLLSTPTLRLYRSDDITGAELGGALKNVIAIAAGVVIGAGLGDSARAALMTRGYAEMQRLALSLGARAETLAGLSGFGDLVLTCTSSQSRNFRFGLSLGRAEAFDPLITVEGAATAKAVSNMARKLGLDMPITTMVAALIGGETTLSAAVQSLLSRPLKQE